MRDLSYWQMRGYPKPQLVPIEQPKPAPVAMSRKAWRRKRAAARLMARGMGGEPMKAKRD